jgi:hypothetical protein
MAYLPEITETALQYPLNISEYFARQCGAITYSIENLMFG